MHSRPRDKNTTYNVDGRIGTSTHPRDHKTKTVGAVEPSQSLRTSFELWCDQQSAVTSHTFSPHEPGLVRFAEERERESKHHRPINQCGGATNHKTNTLLIGYNRRRVPPLGKPLGVFVARKSVPSSSFVDPPLGPKAKSIASICLLVRVVHNLLGGT